MNSLPMTIPDPATARLPVAYEAAQKAISACYRLDEVKDWADKAAAIATYARMAKDDSLRVTAIRIQERAMRRGGELLKQIAPANGANQNIREGDLPKVTRESVARNAGLSEHQRKVALRLANIPDEEFERAVESDSPPTLEALARWGTPQRHQPDSPAVPPADPATASKARGLLREFAAFSSMHDPVSIALGCKSLDPAILRGFVHSIDAWLDRFVTSLPEDEG